MEHFVSSNSSVEKRSNMFFFFEFQNLFKNYIKIFISNFLLSTINEKNNFNKTNIV